MNQYDKYPLHPDQQRQMRFWTYAAMAAIALLCMVVVFAGCGEKEPIHTPCNLANGEWTAQDNEQIYLQFTDGELLSGAYWGGEVHIYERYRYECECDTMFLESEQTGFRFWLTFWHLSDSSAILNGEFYAQPIYLERI